MKKLFFTAIALVAFSGVSMASTIEEKNLPENLLLDDGDYWSCAKDASDMYDEIYSLTGAPDEAKAEGDAIFSECMGTNNNPCHPPFMC